MVRTVNIVALNVERFDGWTEDQPKLDEIYLAVGSRVATCLLSDIDVKAPHRALNRLQVEADCILIY